MRWNATEKKVASALVEVGDGATLEDLVRQSGQNRNVLTRHLYGLRITGHAKLYDFRSVECWSPTQKLIEEHKNW